MSEECEEVMGGRGIRRDKRCQTDAMVKPLLTEFDLKYTIHTQTDTQEHSKNLELDTLKTSIDAINHGP